MVANQPDPLLVERFRADLTALDPYSYGSDQRLLLAVSGGSDSLALLLLANAALGGESILAVTVDHCLRPEAAEEAAFVARLCEDRNIPHQNERLVNLPLYGDVAQGEARFWRYNALEDVCLNRPDVSWRIATAHHVDDQAETMLMRLRRGSGSVGMAGIRPMRDMPVIRLLRPLLKWRKHELIALVQSAGITPVDDPSNRNLRYDRTHARALLASNTWLDPTRLAASAAHMLDANEALDWIARREWDARTEIERSDGRHVERIQLDPEGLPREILRRIALIAFDRLEPDYPPSGPKLDRLLARVQAGIASTLLGIKVAPGEVWTFTPAPPRHKR